MKEEEKEKEIIVQGPSKSVTHPELKVEKDTEKAFEEERFGLLKISHEAGTRFGASMIVSGSFFLCLFTYATLTGHVDWLIISPETTFLGLLVWAFAGTVNVIGGLLLLGSG